VTGLLLFRTRAAWRRRWPSLLALALLVALALAVTATAVAGARRTNGAPGRFIAEDGTPDVQVSLTRLDSLRGVKEISALPEVRDVSVFAGMAAYPYSETGAYMPVLAPVPGIGDTAQLRGVVIAGRRPGPRAADEIMLSEADARILRARVGDRVRLVAFDERQAKRCLYGDDEPADCRKLFRTPQLSVRVVGIARMAADVNNRGTDISVSLLGGRFFERYRASIAWTPGIAVRLRPGVTPESFVAAVHRTVPAGEVSGLDLRNANATFDAVGVLTTGLWLFALVAGLAGAFTVGQAVVRQVRAGDSERAVLATLGASRPALIADALGPVLLATALGAGAAVLAAYVASESMPIGFARRVDPARGRELDGLVMVAGVAIAFVVAAGAAVGAVRSSRRRGVTRATPRGVFAWLVGNATSPAAAVGFRNAFSPGRGSRAVPVRSALVGVTAATAGIVGVLGFSAGLSHLVHSPRLYGWTFDVVGVDTAYTSRVVADPAVGAVADVRFAVPVRVGGRPTFGQVVTPIEGDIGPAIVTGRAPVARDEIALGADTLHAARAHIGGAVTVSGSRGQLPMRVVGQAVFPTGADAYPLADGALLPARSLAVLGPGETSFHSLAIRYRPGVDRSAAFARLDALDARSHPGADPPERPVPPAEIDKLRQVQSLPKVLAGFLALLGVVALAHALVLGVRRRAGDFAVLRSLGFRGRDVRAAVAWEAGALALAGTLLGIPIGIVIARAAWARTARGIGVLVVQRVPFTVVLVVAPAAVAIAIAIAMLPARRAAKLRPAEILRSE